MAGGCEGICCDECGAEITWTPIVIDGRPYCCHDCAVGLECDCASTNFLWEDDLGPLSIWGAEGSVETTYGIDYGFD